MNAICDFDERLGNNNCKLIQRIYTFFNASLHPRRIIIRVPLARQSCDAKVTVNYGKNVFKLENLLIAISEFQLKSQLQNRLRGIIGVHRYESTLIITR